MKDNYQEDNDGGFESICLICFDNIEKDKKFQVSSCKSDNHFCCLLCAKTHFKGLISENKLDGLFCPIGLSTRECLQIEEKSTHETKTNVARLSSLEVEYLFQEDQATLEQFKLLSLKSKDTNLCECPNCRKMCSPNGVEVDPSVTCSYCGAKFCRYHAWGHKPESEKGERSESDICASFEKKLLSEKELTDFQHKLKECPISNCKTLTEKNGGCNHMTCRTCKGHWCWICGKEIINGDFYWHYSENNSDSGCYMMTDEDEHPDVEQTISNRRIRNERLSKVKKFLDLVTIPVMWIFVTVSLLAMLLYTGIIIILDLIVLGIEKVNILNDSQTKKIENLILISIAIIILLPVAIFLILYELLFKMFVIIIGYPISYLVKYFVSYFYGLNSPEDLLIIEETRKAAFYYVLNSIIVGTKDLIIHIQYQYHLQQTAVPENTTLQEDEQQEDFSGESIENKLANETKAENDFPTESFVLELFPDGNNNSSEEQELRQVEDFKKDIVVWNKLPKELGAAEETEVDIEMGIFL